jgi:hypothetical protein
LLHKRTGSQLGIKKKGQGFFLVSQSGLDAGKVIVLDQQLQAKWSSKVLDFLIREPSCSESWGHTEVLGIAFYLILVEDGIKHCVCNA